MVVGWIEGVVIGLVALAALVIGIIAMRQRGRDRRRK